MEKWYIENWATGVNSEVDLMDEDIKSIKNTYMDLDVTVDDMFNIIVIHSDIV